MHEPLTSFEAVLTAQDLICVDRDAVEEFSRGLDRSAILDIRDKIAPITTPFAFESEDQELNFRGLIHMLNIGSQFEPRATEAGQKSLADVILFGIIGAYITHQNLDAAFMKNLSSSDVGQFFSIPRMEKQASEHSWMTIEVPGAMVSYADLLSAVLQSAGSALLDAGYRDIGSFIRSCAGDGSDAAHVVRRLGEVLRCMDDRSEDDIFLAFRSLMLSCRGTDVL
jgi:hypothetical protein